jgi:BMFP domain-containing protein YqiC
MDDTGSGGRKRGSMFDDLAGVAGGAFSALAGVRTEVEAAVRSQVDQMVQRLELVKREELDAAMELARRAREAQEALEARVAALEAQLGGGAEAPAPAEAMPSETSPNTETPPSASGEPPPISGTMKNPPPIGGG